MSKNRRDSDWMSVGDVATAFGVHPGTVRRWDASGILPAAWRTPMGHRRFARTDVALALSRRRS